MNAGANRLRVGVLAVGAAVFVGAAGLGSMTYFHYGDPVTTCASCHEMGGVHAEWSQSAHRTLHCRNCHGGSLTLEVHALEAHVNRVVQHLAGDLDEPIRLAERDVLRAHEACRNCHPQSYADWQSSRHAATYARIFLNPDHHRAEVPADDCLRCHGMFFEGPAEQLLTPLDKRGPWRLLDPGKATQPTIPCSACHRIHSPAGAEQTAKAHFYDCRDEMYFPAAALPVVAPMHDGVPVRVSSDPRQRLCAQCHAPSLAQAHRRGSGDDRTPVGVHEGLSCLDCHQPHTNSARASCGSCHPRDSHCGLDVELMDTTFRHETSRHDIHSVACRDCHPSGRPEARRR